MLEAKFQFAYFCYLEWLYFSCRLCDVFLIPISLIKWKIRKKIKTSTPGNSKFLVLLLGFIHFVGTQNFSKNCYFLPLTRTCTCAYQGVSNVSCSKNFAHLPVFSTWKSLRMLQKARIKIVARAIYTCRFFSFTYNLLFSGKIKSCCNRCFPQQIKPQTTIQFYIYYETVLVWGLV